jgi:competence protein ComEC
MRLYLVAFCLGIGLLQQQADLPPFRWLWLLPLLSAILWLPSYSRFMPETLRRFGVAVLCAALGFAWAAWRADVRLAERLPEHWQGVEIELLGTVVDLPQPNARGERFLLQLDSVLTADAHIPSLLQLAWYWPRGSLDHVARIHAGEQWRMTVRLNKPHGTSNPHGFDLEAWMLERGIGAVGYVRDKHPPQRVASLALSPAAWLAATRDSVRQRILQTLAGRPYANVITALVIGDQSAIPSAQWRAFTRTGVNHLISISGLHVTMIAALAGWLVAALWRRRPRLAERIPARKIGLAAALIAALAYVLLAGFQAPAQRTLYMLAVLVLAYWNQRETRPTVALAWALFGVLLLDPWAVLAPGFWLSFGAMAVILWVTVGRVGEGSKLSAWVSVQTAVTLALAPALLLLFQQVSLVSPLANAVAIPVVSWLVTPLALLGVALPFCLVWAEQIMAMLGDGLGWLATQNFAVWTLPAPSISAVLLALVGTLWLLLPRGFVMRWLGVFLWLPLLFPPRDAITPNHFRAEVIDVGQGTAILIRTAAHSLLYDTGPAYTDSDAGERIVVPYLRATGVSRLSGMIVSHNDNDHTGGMTSVLRDEPVGWLLHGLPVSSPLLPNAPMPQHCVRGQHWHWDGVDFEILNPPADAYLEPDRKDNNYSCVLKVSVPEQSLLITGDGEKLTEQELLTSAPEKLPASVLVAGHHGSLTSSTPEFIAHVHPAQVIFNMGYRNRFGHPKPQVVERYRAMGTAVFRSDRDGLIRLDFGRDGIHTSQYRPNHRHYWQYRFEPGRFELDAAFHELD